MVVVYDCSRECLTFMTDTPPSSLRVTRKLDAFIRLRGKPITVVSDMEPN